MKRNVFLSALFLLLTAMFPFAQPAPHDKKPTYEGLVERVKTGDKSVDFRELRLAYVGSETRQKYADTDPQKKAMNEALRNKDFGKALENAEIVLKNNFVDMDAHYCEYAAYREQQKGEQADAEKYILGGLLQSIASSGDGKSPETAFQVIEVHEEYVVLHFSGLMPGKQSLLHKNGHSYDVMEAVNPKTNEKVTLYFNVDIPFAQYPK